MHRILRHRWIIVAAGALALWLALPANSFAQRNGGTAADALDDPDRWQTDTTGFTLGYVPLTTSGMSVGLKLEFGRVRGRHFNFTVFDLVIGWEPQVDWDEQSSSYMMMVQLLAMGAKLHMGSDGRHELGFLAGILGAVISRYEHEEDWLREVTGLFPFTIYYRYNWNIIHLEAGVILPLVWYLNKDSGPDQMGSDYDSSDITADEIYHGRIPLMLYVGMGY